MQRDPWGSEEVTRISAQDVLWKEEHTPNLRVNRNKCFEERVNSIPGKNGPDRYRLFR